MIYGYLFLPLAGLVLVIFQTSVLDLFFKGFFNAELSMIMVIYAGFRMNVMQGAILSFLIGFFMDCAMGSASGLYALIYICIFFISVGVSQRIYAEQTRRIMAFAFFCTVLEGLIMGLFYKITYDINMIDNVFRVFLPQALGVSILSPLLFRTFHFFEGLFHGGASQPKE